MGATRRIRAIVFLVVVAAIAVGLDWALANREVDRLVAAIESSESATIEGRDDLQRRYADSDWAGINPDAGVVDPGFATPLERQDALEDVRADVSNAAGSAAASVQVAGAEVEDVWILPWHLQAKRARAAYLEHNAAWVKYLRAVSAKPEKMRDRVLLADISATFKIASRRLQDAIPVFSLHNSENRIKAIFAD
jgi:hypothetical protein